MDQDLVNRWIEALRSGKYTQTTGVLRNGSCFCCLGVLCDVSTDMGKWVGGSMSDCVDYVWSDIHHNHLSGQLPKNLREAAGLSEGNEQELMGMNDRGDSFKKIANRIEAITQRSNLKAKAKAEESK